MLHKLRMFLEHPETQPFSQKFILRFLVVLLVVVALAAGYYEVVDETWQAKYDRLHTQMLKVQQQLAASSNATPSAIPQTSANPKMTETK